MATILVVDDAAYVRELIGEVLEGEGHRVVQAEDGEQALKILSGSTPVDLMLTDIIMPGIDGIAAIMEARKLRPDLRVLAMSGGGFNLPGDYLAAAGMLGAHGTITKPFGPTELLREVERVMGPPPSYVTH